MKAKILIIDDDESIRKVLEYTLAEAGCDVMSARSGEEGLSLFPSYAPHVVITDLKMSGIDGMRVLEEIKKTSPETSIIVLTAFGTIGKAVEAMKKGAYDYLTKPFDKDELKLTLTNALRIRRLERENLRLKEELLESARGEIVASSPKMKAVLEDIEKIAPSDATVLITGESGTGKELVARTIHRLSHRRSSSFITVNCAAIPRELMESELFGHERGAFTGAIREKIGKFEQADGGTIFLDEIAELDSSLQAKLLRVLQEREVERVGGRAPFIVDVRILAATNTDLKAAMAQGSFREDLYYRLSVIPIHIPPLRERREDIVPLAEYFMKKSEPRKTISVSKEVMDAFLNYRWPGNVRELGNLCERLLILRRGNRIEIDDLPQEVKPSIVQGRGTTGAPKEITLPEEGVSLEEAEKGLILQALERCGWNQTKAAALLKIPRHVLIYRIEKYGLREKANVSSGLP